jgi:hypothetical protein
MGSPRASSDFLPSMMLRPSTAITRPSLSPEWLRTRTW